MTNKRECIYLSMDDYCTDHIQRNVEGEEDCEHCPLRPLAKASGVNCELFYKAVESIIEHGRGN